MPDQPTILEPDYSDPFSQAQDRIVEACKALPLLAARNVPVEPERRGDIVQTITTLLNRLGVAVCVLEPINGVFDEPEEPTAEIDIEYVIEVVENVLVNRNPDAPAEGEEAPVRATAFQVMGAILQGLNGQPTGILNSRHRLGLFRADRAAFRRIPHKTLSVYQLPFHVGISLAQPQ